MEYLIIAIILFIAIDLLIRYLLKQHQEKKMVQDREKALEVGLNLDYSSEAKTLKRVEVENPKAKILCVDDEEVILDSFRKILVIDGYSVDTVENGKEALGLIQTHHYDFVYTDLKMPVMDGVDVTKSVKHIRPDIDVIIITGYATVETAVETMKFGAMDYVQKPFTEEELLEFTKKCLYKRQERIKGELKPKVQITHLSETEKPDAEEFLIPGGVFISEGHCWVSVSQNGSVKVGIDDFAKKVIGRIDDVEMPNLGRVIKVGDILFTVKKNNKMIPFKSPISGKVIKINSELSSHPHKLEVTSYGQNWICTLDADNLDLELKELKIGKSAIIFYQEEIEHCHNQFKEFVDMKKIEKEMSGKNGRISGVFEKIDEKEISKFVDRFFKT